MIAVGAVIMVAGLALSTVQQADNALGVALLGIVSYGRSAVVCRTRSAAA